MFAHYKNCKESTVFRTLHLFYSSVIYNGFCIVRLRCFTLPLLNCLWRIFLLLWIFLPHVLKGLVFCIRWWYAHDRSERQPLNWLCLNLNDSATPNLLLDEPSKRFVNVNTWVCVVSLVQFCHSPIVSCISKTQIESSMLFFPIFLILVPIS